MKKSLLPLFFLLTLFASGCVSPIKVQDSPLPVSTTGTEKVSISVIESRPYVLSGKKSERYEGIIHGVYGIPTNLNNMEKKKFSDYIGERLELGFKNAGYTVERIQVKQNSTNEEFLWHALKTDSSKYISVRLTDWRIDWGGFLIPSWQFFYDIEISILDNSGTLLARKSFTGKDAPPVIMKESMTNNSLLHYQKRFKEFFEDPVIVDALNGIRSEEPVNELSIKQRLEYLEELLKGELISQEEYDTVRENILNEM